MNTSKKKIVLLSSSLAGGGSESVCVSIANSFADKGWQVDLVVLNLKNETYLNRLSKNINLVVLNVNHARYCFLPLLKYIYKENPKIALVFNYELSAILVMLRLSLKLKIKIISRNNNTMSIKLEEFDDLNFWSRNIVKPLIKYFYKKIDHVVNQCHDMQKDLIALYPELNKNSSVIFNPLPAHIQEYATNHDLSLIKKENYLLCVGRLEKQKSFHYIIEAFAGIVNKFPKLRLKIVGKGNLEKELKQKAFEYSVEDKVDFEGFQKNIIPYYLYAKATVLTSIYEGYPNVLIESIAMNTPVVAFDCVSGPNEIIHNGINGYLVNYKDIDDLKKKLSITLSKKFNYKDLKKSISQNQIKQVYNDYDKLLSTYI